MEIFYSIVIPVLNEEESLRELVAKIKKVLSSYKKPYEIVFVDDGSTDRTLEILQILEKENREIRIFSFRRNLGKSYALMLGFREARGKIIVTMDADLQDDPKNIKELQARLIRGNYDIVTGWRRQRRDNLFKVFSSKLFNYIVSSLFGIKIHDLNSGLKMYKKDATKDLKLYGGMHRFIPIIASELGYRVGEQEVMHYPRKYGESKYKASKIITDIPDLITIYFLTKYTRRPLHFFGKIGTFIFFAGVLVLLYLSYLHFLGQSIGRRPLLFLGILLTTTGIQTIFTGLIADLIVNVNYTEHPDYPLKYESQE